MKDEFEGKIVDEFVGSNSKMYSKKLLSYYKFNTANVVNIVTEFKEFKDTLFNKKIIRNEMKRFQSKKHKLGTQEINRISLSCFDDKGFVLNDGIHTLFYFHKDIYSHRLKRVLTDKKELSQIKNSSHEKEKILRNGYKYKQMRTNRDLIGGSKGTRQQYSK